MVCARGAWLELDDGTTLALEDEGRGYFCRELNLGWPAVRESSSNRPDQHGLDDRTSLFGGRVVSANITALKGAGAVIDEVASAFGPFMVLSVRAELHYVLERAANPERVLGELRSVAYGWPIVGDDQREVQLQWIAADPVAYDPTDRSAAAWAGGGAVAGRTYDLRFDRAYADGGGGSGPTSAVIRSEGDLPIQPALDIYGPITKPWVHFTLGSSHWSVAFADGFRIDAGERVSIDTRAHTAYRNGDPSQPVIGSVDWSNTTWPVLPPRSDVMLSMTAAQGGQSHITQVVASWRDGYLT